jgi:hypothetical protein
VSSASNCSAIIFTFSDVFLLLVAPSHITFRNLLSKLLEVSWEIHVRDTVTLFQFCGTVFVKFLKHRLSFPQVLAQLDNEKAYEVDILRLVWYGNRTEKGIGKENAKAHLKTYSLAVQVLM